LESSDIYYLYGIIPVSGALPTDQLITYKNLAAVFKMVPASEFDSDNISLNLQDLAWLEQQVVAHNARLQEVIKHGTVVPFKFGSLFSSKQAVEKMLQERYVSFSDMLSELQGQVEWGLKLSQNNKALRDSFAHSEERDSSLSPGQAFLAKKRREEATKLDHKQLVNKQRKLVYALAKDLSANCKILEESPTEKGSTHTNILNLSVLADDHFSSSFFESYESEGVNEVFKCTITGPWPPYNFVE